MEGFENMTVSSKEKGKEVNHIFPKRVAVFLFKWKTEGGETRQLQVFISFLIHTVFLYLRDHSKDHSLCVVTIQLLSNLLPALCSYTKCKLNFLF